MKYINNWSALLTSPLSPGDTVLPIPPEAAARLDLSGVYWLTLTDSANPLEQTQWEIVEVSAGLAIARGKDGTTAQDWPAETLIYCALTAGQLTALQNRIEDLEAGGGGEPVTEGALVDETGDTLVDENSNILVGG